VALEGAQGLVPLKKRVMEQKGDTFRLGGTNCTGGSSWCMKPEHMGECSQQKKGNKSKMIPISGGVRKDPSGRGEGDGASASCW